MRNIFLVPFAAAILLGSSVCAATVYKCKNGAGAMIYQESPCAGEVQAVSSWTGSPAVHDFSLSGFQGVPWGAGESAILARFGNGITRLGRPEAFYNLHTNLVIEKYNLGNTVLKASFQMSNDTNKLAGVLISKVVMSGQKQAFLNDYDYLLAFMTQKLGKPAQVRQNRYRWIVGDTAVELDYLYQADIIENLTVHYLPNT